MNNVFQEEEIVLRKLGYSNWLDTIKKTVIHEWEGSITSQAAMKRIISNPIAKRYFQERATIDRGLVDQLFGIAARIAKVYATDAWFMTKNAAVSEFSLFGGPFNHVHYISSIMASLLGQLVHRSESEKKLENKDFAFYRGNEPLGIIRLSTNGIIKLYKNPNETLNTFLS